MAYRKPTHAYWSLLLPVIPHGVNWMIETFIKTQKWWGDLPLFWLTWVFLAVGAGLVLGDCYNKNSWLRHNLREFFKVFEVRACFVGQEIVPPHEYFSLICLIKFTKEIQDAKLVVRVIQVLPCGNIVHVVHSESITAHKDSERRLRLGSIPIHKKDGAPAKHAVWGEVLGDTSLAPGQYSLGVDAAVIEVSLGWQKYHAYLSKQPTFITDVHAPISLINETDLEAFIAAI